jgi:SAM-dependent methyltransferase
MAARSKVIVSNDEYLWNQVWHNAPYADENLRKTKANAKIDVLLSYLTPNPTWHMVELGCGSGHLVEEIYKRTHCRITGVDFSRIALDKAKIRLKDYPIDFILSDANNTNIPSCSVDMVICSGIIEHISDINSIFKEIRRILKPKGYIFIVSSNAMSFTYLERFIRQSLGFWKYGYIKNWLPLSLQSYVSSQGFSVDTVDRIVSIGNLKLFALLDKPLSLLFNHWGRYIILLGRKK